MWYTMVTLNPMVLVGTMLGSWYLGNMLLSNNAMLFTTFWGSYFGTGWHKKTRWMEIKKRTCDS